MHGQIFILYKYDNCCRFEIPTPINMVSGNFYKCSYFTEIGKILNKYQPKAYLMKYPQNMYFSNINTYFEIFIS